MWIEIIGYVGMGFVLLSFLMKNVKWIRIINLIGSALSLTYGILTITIPTAALNGSLLVINGVYLILIFTKEFKDKKKAKEANENKENSENKEGNE